MLTPLEITKLLPVILSKRVNMQALIYYGINYNVLKEINNTTSRNIFYFNDGRNTESSRFVFNFLSSTEHCG